MLGLKLNHVSKGAPRWKALSVFSYVIRVRKFISLGVYNDDYVFFSLILIEMSDDISMWYPVT